MKTNILLIITGALLVGCVSSPSGLILNTVGPAPGQIVIANSNSGTLKVFSAHKVNADFNSPDPYRREYSDYRILDSNKKLVKWVHNVTNDMLQEPVDVKLTAGKYFVVARSNGYGIVTIPTIIAAGQNTTLHLDGGNDLTDGPASNANNTVRLPDGEIVGCSASN